MKKESKYLLNKGINSLILSIEHFNRPYDLGRSEAVLIFLDHAFEMLLKASILFKGGKIRKKREKQTIGFDECLRSGVSNETIKFLDEDQVLVLQTINNLRDGAQHYLLDISEEILYTQAQSGLTLFRDLYKSVFCKDLSSAMPKRVLPLSTIPLVDITALFDNELKEVKKLLSPGKRKKVEARAKVRTLAIIDGAILGEKVQPSQSVINNIISNIQTGKQIKNIFLGISSIELTTKGDGPSIDLRITKKEGVPVQLVPEGTPGATVVALKRVDELGYYSLGRDQLAEKVGLTGPKTSAVIEHLNLKNNSDYYKKITIRKAAYDCYSQKAIEAIKDCINKKSVDDIWKEYWEKRSG